MASERKVILYIAMSLDGFIADRYGSVDWLPEGEGDFGYSDFYETIDTLIMGRTTYDQILSFGIEWPYAGKKCYVFTNRDHPSDSNTEFLTGDILSFVHNLKSKPGKNIWLVGGAAFANAFMEYSLIDEYWVAVIPVILGDGVRLFRDGNPSVRLSLQNLEQYEDVVVLHYMADKINESGLPGFSLHRD